MLKNIKINKNQWLAKLDEKAIICHLEKHSFLLENSNRYMESEEQVRKIFEMLQIKPTNQILTHIQINTSKGNKNFYRM